MLNIGYIYMIENMINHKKYIGQTTDPQRRWRCHKNDDIKSDTLIIGKAFRKYGVENFHFSIIEECEDELMSEREIFWIAKLNTCVKNEGSWGYNMTCGGESLYGKYNPFYGKRHTEDSKRIMSEKQSMRTGEKNPFYGKHHSEQTRLLIGQKNTNKKRSDEFKRNLSEINTGCNNPFYGKEHTEKTKAKLRNQKLGTIPYNAIEWVATNDDEEWHFVTIGYVLKWLYIKGLVSPDEHFTMSMLKKRLKKSFKNKTMYMGYYWEKSVETNEITDINQEESRVDSEIGAESKREGNGQ